jgi:hypothetical protein
LAKRFCRARRKRTSRTSATTASSKANELLTTKTKSNVRYPPVLKERSTTKLAIDAIGDKHRLASDIKTNRGDAIALETLTNPSTFYDASGSGI